MGCFISCFHVQNHEEFTVTDNSSNGHSMRFDDGLVDDSFHGCAAVSEAPIPPSITTAAENPESDDTILAEEAYVCHGGNPTETRDKGSEENQTGVQCHDPDECLEDENVCPICLEGYTPENPKIFTLCSHDYHLGCILDWMERSVNCPYCYKVMTIDDLI